MGLKDKALEAFKAGKHLLPSTDTATITVYDKWIGQCTGTSNPTATTSENSEAKSQESK